MILRKSLLLIIATILTANLLCSCDKKDDADVNQPVSTYIDVIFTTPETSDEGSDNTDSSEDIEASEATEAAAATEIATAEPTEDPYANSAIPKKIDLQNIKAIYLTPGESKTADYIDDASLWTVSDNDSITSEKTSDGIKLTAKATGMTTITNSSTGDKIYVYVNNEVEKTEDRKVEEGLPYYIYYEKGSHTMTIYEADEEGYYTVPVRTICSACGSTPAKTPVGIHKLGEKMRWKTFSASCYAPYGICYSSGVYLHGPCYSEQKENTILSHYYNTIGENSTGGCLRMQTGNIYWIYQNCPTGTTLEIVDGNPLGTVSEKPAEISDSSCYDPTDPACPET